MRDALSLSHGMSIAGNLEEKVAAGALAYSDLKEWEVHPTGRDNEKAAGLWKASMEAVAPFLGS